MANLAGRARTVAGIVLAITLVKASGFLLLSGAGIIKPFAGSNAENFFIPVAHRLLDEGRFNGPDSRSDSKAPPLYPLIVAATIAVAPKHFLLLLTVVQMFFDAGTAWILYRIACRFARPTTGLIAACGWLLFPPAVASSTWVTMETTFIFFFTLSLLVVMDTLRNRRVIAGVGAGLLLGLAVYARPTPLLLAPALLPLFLWARAWRAWLALAAAMALLVGAWTIRNLVVLGDFIPIAVGSGSALMNGADEAFFTIYGRIHNYKRIVGGAVAGGALPLQSQLESERDAFQGRVGVWLWKKRLRERPLSIVSILANKAARLWYATETGTPRTQWLLGLCSLLVVPAAFWQWFRWRRDCPALAWTTATVVAYFAAVHLVTFAEFRYMLPVFPLLILAAADKVSAILLLASPSP